MLYIYQLTHPALVWAKWRLSVDVCVIRERIGEDDLTRLQIDMQVPCLIGVLIRAYPVAYS